MEEKILIKSERYNIKKVLKIILIIGVGVSILGSIICIIDSCNRWSSGHEHSVSCYDFDYRRDFDSDKLANNLDERKMDCYAVRYDSAFSYALGSFFSDFDEWAWLIPGTALALICGLIYLWFRSYELVVTDKRIYGKIAWGKRVDLPVDSVSATSTIRLFKGVSVSTSSGRISFRVIKNADEIYKVINNLVIERQQNKVNATVVAATPKSDEIDQLKRYKDLLDSGVITQEEFNAKKKQLLGI